MKYLIQQIPSGDAFKASTFRPIRPKDNIPSQQSYSSTNTLRVCITSAVKQYTDESEKWKASWQMCTGKKNTLWLRLSITQHLVFWSHSGEHGRAVESVSACVSVCRTWHDFVSEYWTSLLCVLRQKRIVQWHLSLSRHGEGRVISHNFSAQHIKGLQFLNVSPFWADAPPPSWRQSTYTQSGPWTKAAAQL